MLPRTRRRLYLSREATTIGELDRTNRLVVLRYAELPDSDAVASIGEILTHWSERRYLAKVTEVVVADHWCRYFMVTPPLNAMRLSDLSFAAAERFRVLYDEEPFDWLIEADWIAKRAFLACAMFRPLLETIDVADMPRVRAVVPQTVDYGNRYRKHLRHRSAWLVTTAAERAVITVYDHDSVEDIHHAAIAEGMWDNLDVFRMFLARECLRLNRPAPAEVLLCGTIQVNWQETSVDGTSIRIKRESVVNEVDSDQLLVSAR